jgi:PEP-CTERM motif-containing protein
MVTGGRLKSICFVLVLGFAAQASASVVYNESVSGDLSGAGLAPTAIGALSLGSNQIFGLTGSTGGVTDRDYFTITVPNGLELSAIIEGSGTQSGRLSFIGMEAGPQVTLPTNTTTAAGLLGWWHYSPADIGTNVLADMSVASMGSSGFTAPLGAGTYAFWVQDTSAGTFAYAFDLQVVPEPATYALMLLGLGACAVATRRRARISVRDWMATRKS